MRKACFPAAIGVVASGLVVMSIMGAGNDDGVHSADVMRAAILSAIILCTWLVVGRLDRIHRQLLRAERRRIEREADRELLVAQTIAATLKAVGHEMGRADAKLYQINR